jgi:hypothetical protein
MEGKKYKVEAMPTLVFIRQSKELERIVGGDIGRITGALKKYYKETLASGHKGYLLYTPTGSTKKIILLFIFY